MRPTLSSPLLSQLSEFVATQTGLYFPEERWGDLLEADPAYHPAFSLHDAPYRSFRVALQRRPWPGRAGFR